MNRRPVPAVRASSFCVTPRPLRVSRTSLPISCGVYFKSSPRSIKLPYVLVVENEQEVFTAMVALKQGKGSFADAIILALGARAGCSYTLTFDQKASRLSGFRLA